MEQQASPLSRLSLYLISDELVSRVLPSGDKIGSLKEHLLFHSRVMTEVSEKYSAGKHQVMFMRTISLYGILLRAQKLFPFPEEAVKLLKTFPKIGTFKNDDVDNIRFHPISIEKLQEIILPSFRDLPRLCTALEEIIFQELAVLEKDSKEIREELGKVPDIICKDLSDGLKKDPKHPRVSIITTSMNLAEMIDETMLSIKNQTYPLIEHIVIDGASTDGSQEIIKKYNDVILVSEKDAGYTDAFWKGLRIAKGEYILQCCISDSYAARDWVERCVKILDKNPDISLVSGHVCGIDNKSRMVDCGLGEFQFSEAPSRSEMFDYWIRTGIYQTENNLCVRKTVLLDCFPSVEECNNHILEWVEFGYRFNRKGFLSYQLPILANFSHVGHDNKRGLSLSVSGEYKRMLDNYRNKLNRYRWQLIFGVKKHSFITPDGKNIPIKFKRKSFILEYFPVFLSQQKKYLQPKKYLNYFKKILKRKSFL